MDRAGYGFLCLLLVLTASAHLGLGQPIGTVTILNDADGAMTYQMIVHLSNGGQTIDPSPTPFPEGSQVVHQVMPDEVFVYTLYQLTTPSGAKVQATPLEWSAASVGGILNCMPNCYIVIDNSGFSQASSPQGPLQAYWAWGQN